MSNMIQVRVDSVRVSLMSPQRIILLREIEGERSLPIFVGPYEAEAITVALQQVEMARPLTHDLLKDVISAFGARIVRIEIIALRDNIFYGNIVAEKEGKLIDIDSRPSDAIAMAVRAHVPILVDPTVMDSASILPEENLQEERGKTSPIEADRLSIFEDFFDQLESKPKDDQPSDDKPEDAPDEET